MEGAGHGLLAHAAGALTGCYTSRAETCYGRIVPDESVRINVTLPPELGEKLSRIAARMHLREGTIASSLLARAIEDADPDADAIVDLLDRIPGAWERIDAGVAEVRRGRTVPFAVGE